MAILADILLAGGAFGAAVYCLVLSRRLRKFSRLDSGVGGAVATLSAQVDELTRTLSGAQETARSSSESLRGLTGRAEEVAERLEMLLAAMHDLPEPAQPVRESRRLRVRRPRPARDLVAAE